MKEIWVDVPNYEGEYQVSSTGMVKSVKKNKILHPYINQGGYCRVYLYKEAKRKSFTVHRLVALAFIRNGDSSKDQINHIDGNKSNNNASNLEWCTQSENLSHSFRIGLRDHNMKRLVETNRKPVLQMSMEGKMIKEWYSMSEAARNLGLDVSNISNCCKGVIGSTGGYKWRKKFDY